MEWTEKKERRLKKLWPSQMTNKAIADRLGATAQELAAKAKEIGLPSRAEARKAK